MLIKDTYTKTLEDIKQKIYESRHQAFSAVNKVLINLYWEIGKTIVEKQESESWGDSTVERLAKDLQIEFAGIRGFSAQNLYRMRDIYIAYKDNSILSTLLREIGWSHNVVILHKCSDPQQREFYMKMVKLKGWSVRTLSDKIESKEFEKWAISQNNFSETLPATLARKGEVMLKDEYNLDFLEIEEEVLERELEDKIVSRIDKFLKEMDGNMMFSGRQVRLEVGKEEFFVDLLFYHKLLRSYIVIELKTNKYKPEYAGKMALYLGAIENQMNDKSHDNPAIGIILCKDKDRDVVETSLRVIARPVGVATYKTYKNTNELPSEISKYLPSTELIADKLLSLTDANTKI